MRNVYRDLEAAQDYQDEAESLLLHCADVTDPERKRAFAETARGWIALAEAERRKPVHPDEVAARFSPGML
jgi:hypothetical protein